MKKRAVIRILWMILKYLVALAAAVNLVALFVFHYELPSWLRREDTETVEEPYEEEPAAAPTESPNDDGIHYMLPVVPITYSGEADLDGMVMDGVYLLDEDDQPIEDAVIRYEILPGETRLKKTVIYSTELEDGEILTEERAMNLTSRYTGPKITLLGILPDIDPAEKTEYADLLADQGVIRADDGFGNDITDQVFTAFRGLSDENPDAKMTLQLENQIHDTAQMELTVNVKDYTGVVLTLLKYRVTITEGDEFDPYQYVKVAHDAEGNDLTESVTVTNDADTSVPGEYEIVYWVQDSEETYSPSKTLHLTVEAAPEESEGAEETEEETQ